MPRVPRITGSELLRALQRSGWVEVRRRGSHAMLRRSNGTGRVVVPVHAGKILKPKTLLAIIDAAGVSSGELSRLV